MDSYGYSIPADRLCKDCGGDYAQYRVAKKFGRSRPTWSKKPLYCYHCAKDRAAKRIQIEKDERNDRIRRGQAVDADILQGLAEDLREEVARMLGDAGHHDLSDLVSDTPIIMNSQYSRVLGRAHSGSKSVDEGGNRCIEWSLKAYQNAGNVSRGAFRRTILHEWAHILEFASIGRSSNHGQEWRRWTHFLGIPEATAISWDVYSSRRVKKYARTEDMDQAVENESARIR